MTKANQEWYPVRVYFPADGVLPAETFDDEIRGTSPEKALENACWNWEDAEKIELR